MCGFPTHAYMWLPVQVPEGLDATASDRATTTTTSSNSKSQQHPGATGASDTASTEAPSLHNPPFPASIAATAAPNHNLSGPRVVSHGVVAASDSHPSNPLPLSSPTAASHFGADGPQSRSNLANDPTFSPPPNAAVAGTAFPLGTHHSNLEAIEATDGMQREGRAEARSRILCKGGSRGASSDFVIPPSSSMEGHFSQGRSSGRGVASGGAGDAPHSTAIGVEDAERLMQSGDTTEMQSCPQYKACCGVGVVQGRMQRVGVVAEYEAKAPYVQAPAAAAACAAVASLGPGTAGARTCMDTAPSASALYGPTAMQRASRLSPAELADNIDGGTAAPDVEVAAATTKSAGGDVWAVGHNPAAASDTTATPSFDSAARRNPASCPMPRARALLHNSSGGSSNSGSSGLAYDSFSFDAFELAAVTQGHPLSTLAYYLFHKSNLISSFGLHTVKLARFLRSIEAGYCLRNPYHNATHAADVLQTLHVIMHRGAMVPQFADRLSVMAALLAAIMHDVEHMGLTNDFLINSSSALAIRYNDRAPLENHHLASGFTVLNTPDHNFLSSLPIADYGRLRKIVIDLVLATDMKQHFALVGQFKALVRRVTPKSKSATAPSQKSRAHSRILSSSQSVLMDSLSARTPNSTEFTVNLPKRTSVDESLAVMAGAPVADASSPLSQSPQGLDTSRSLSRLIHGPSPLDSPSLHQLRHLRRRMSLPQRVSLDAKPTVAAEQLHAAVCEASQAAGSLPLARISRTSEPNQGVACGTLALKLSMSAHSRGMSSIPAAGGPGSSYNGNNSTAHSPVANSLCSSGNSNKISDHSSEHSRGSAPRAAPGKEGDPASLDDTQKLLLLQIALKCADLGHVCEEHQVHVRWVHPLEEEFYRQGDREKAAGLPVSPLFDRDKPGVTKSQVGFFDVVVFPLFQALATLLPGVQPLLDGAEANKRFWKAEQQQR
ncbi:hypothetical protein DUNSADRAFT_1468 [Dunaliella salina]|uniref:Phosphodiesterase n=1 Tax=Dunaliella salina TaxID=3046 RepID=A0ABQ7GX27_DUNSA|nr:hypothetical protein DUNSADRAFT_1468 [Dunaliella salina]|eukprot:KAF5839155.1 hypothetical protein DUNSADRAFT_1468 [Dunaliella salina]